MDPVASGSSLPSELDFFGTSAASPDPNDRAAAKKSKKRKRAADAAGALSSLRPFLTQNSWSNPLRHEAAAEAAGIDYPAFLRQHRIKYTGLDPPNPIISFAELASTHNCPDSLSLNWEKMGLDKPTGVQLAAWGVMLQVRRLRVDCAESQS